MTNVAAAVIAAFLAAVGASADRTPGRGHRFFDLQAAIAETRYRFIESSSGTTLVNQWQHKQTIRGAFKFDERGRYTVQALLGTGNSFTVSWDATGVGTGDPAWDFRVRRLWARAAPIAGVELDAGSFDVLRGETTEIVSYDNDAFMQGYRVSLKRPKLLVLDEISVTAGYLGDLTEPNVFKRFKWLDHHNYSQALVAKHFGTLISASMDWTSVDHVDTVREGLRIGTKDLLRHVVDDVRMQAYQRTDSPTGRGVAAEAERFFTERVMAYGGYSQGDRNNIVPTGDRYGRGKRVYGGGSVNLRPELMLAGFYTHAFANDFAIANNERFDVVLSYNVLKALQQHKAW
jgi:hypothetical protein